VRRTFTAKIVSFGRITIPKEVRKELDIREGDLVKVEGLTKLVLTEQNSIKNTKEEA